MLKRVLRSRRGEGYIDVCVLVICAMLVIALAVKIMPVYIATQHSGPMQNSWRLPCTRFGVNR